MCVIVSVCVLESCLRVSVSVPTDLSQPRHWEAMNGENVKLVDLDPASAEYQQVVKLSGGMTVKKARDK